MSKTIKEGEIEKILLEEIKPMLARHRGNIELVKFEKGVVYVKLLGACRGCPLSELTLKAFVEEVLKSKIPEVVKVETAQ